MGAKFVRERFTSAHVLAIVALFVSLGSTSIAAVQLRKNDVLSRHIKNGQVKRADLARNSVTSAKVLDGSLLARDFRPGQLPAGAKGEAGPRGDTGTRGETGTRGPTGPPGPLNAAVSITGFTPNQDPDGTVNTAAQITLSQPSRLIALGTGAGTVTCGATDPCHVVWGLYLDGEPLPSSGHAINSDATETRSESVAIHGRTDVLPVGSYQVTIRSDPNPAVDTEGSAAQPRVTVFAVAP